MKRKYLKACLLPMGLLILLLSSCLDKDLESYKTQERKDINEYIEGQGFTDIGGYGIYLKFYNRSTVEALDDHIEDGNAFTMNYDGEFLTGELWETTDSVKGAENFPGIYKVYGPAQFRAGSISMFGLDTALKYFSPGDTGTVVIPSWYAWYDDPRVLHIGVKEVVEDDSVHAENALNSFITANNISTDKELFDGVYYKIVDDPEASLSDTAIRDLGDTATFNIIGRYAETYYSNNKGRIFYPLLSYSSTISDRAIGTDDASFPLRDAIDSVLLKMEVGQTVEMATSFENGWEDDGYYDDTTNINLIPEYMPLHYTIELIETIE